MEKTRFGRNLEFTLEMAFSREVKAVPSRVIHIQTVIMILRWNHVAKWGRELSRELAVERT